MEPVDSASDPIPRVNAAASRAFSCAECSRGHGKFVAPSFLIPLRLFYRRDAAAGKTSPLASPIGRFARSAIFSKAVRTGCKRASAGLRILNSF